MSKQATYVVSYVHRKLPTKFDLEITPYFAVNTGSAIYVYIVKREKYPSLEYVLRDGEFVYCTYSRLFEGFSEGKSCLHGVEQFYNNHGFLQIIETKPDSEGTDTWVYYKQNIYRCSDLPKVRNVLDFTFNKYHIISDTNMFRTYVCFSTDSDGACVGSTEFKRPISNGDLFYNRFKQEFVEYVLDDWTYSWSFQSSEKTFEITKRDEEPKPIFIETEAVGGLPCVWYPIDTGWDYEAIEETNIKETDMSFVTTLIKVNKCVAGGDRIVYMPESCPQQKLSWCCDVKERSRCDMFHCLREKDGITYAQCKEIQTRVSKSTESDLPVLYPLTVDISTVPQSTASYGFTYNIPYGVGVIDPSLLAIQCVSEAFGFMAIPHISTFRVEIHCKNKKTVVLVNREQPTKAKYTVEDIKESYENQ